MKPLSSGRTVLTRNLANVGVKVHQASIDNNKEGGEFVQLQCIPTQNLDANDDTPIHVVQEVVFRVMVGASNNVMVITMPVFREPTTLLTNVWVWSGEEVWVSTSHPDKFMIHGTASKHGVPFVHD